MMTLPAMPPVAGELACPHCGAGVAPTASTCDHCGAALLNKACPRCLSRVFHGHKHCPECGAEHLERLRDTARRELAEARDAARAAASGHGAGHVSIERTPAGSLVDLLSSLLG